MAWPLVLFDLRNAKQNLSDMKITRTLIAYFWRKDREFFIRCVRRTCSIYFLYEEIEI